MEVEMEMAETQSLSVCQFHKSGSWKLPAWRNVSVEP